jgi:hypothetical protein
MSSLLFPENNGGGITNYVIHYMSIVDDNNDTKRCNNTIMPTEQMNATLDNATIIRLKNLQAFWNIFHQVRSKSTGWKTQ